MADDIHTTLNATIKEGKIDEFKALVKEMGNAVESNEPGARRYQFYLNNDETQYVVNESYAGLEALDAHLKGVASQTILPKIFNIIKINRFEEFGDINDELKEVIAQMGGVNYGFFSGFSSMSA